MMKRFSALLLAAFIALAMASPASAHRLKLFARIEGNAVSGYGFYIGGGRPQGAEIVIRDASSAEIARVTTSTDGSFVWQPPIPGRYSLKIDGGDGHFAETTVDFSANGQPAAPVAASATAPAPATTDTADLDARIAASVDAAVARQITPLLEAYAEADGRVRFNDLIGGLGWIVGMAGLFAWLRAARRG